MDTLHISRTRIRTQKHTNMHVHLYIKIHVYKSSSFIYYIKKIIFFRILKYLSIFIIKLKNLFL
jgi:hypothetical protein